MPSALSWNSMARAVRWTQEQLPYRAGGDPELLRKQLDKELMAISKFADSAGRGYRGFTSIQDQLRAITVADFGANTHDIHSWVRRLKRIPGVAETRIRFAKSSLRIVSDRNVYDPYTSVVTGTTKPGDASIEIVFAHDEYPVELALSSTTSLASHLTGVSKYIWTRTMPLYKSLLYLESKVKLQGHAFDVTFDNIIARIRRLEIIVHGEVQSGGALPRLYNLFDTLKISFIFDWHHDIDVE